MRKMNFGSFSDVARFAVRQGLIPYFLFKVGVCDRMMTVKPMFMRFWARNQFLEVLDPIGEKQNQPLQLSFNSSLKVDFQGSRVTSDGGLLLVRELDERLGLSELIREQQGWDLTEFSSSNLFQLQCPLLACCQNRALMEAISRTAASFENICEN
jgi:hypothetical protein